MTVKENALHKINSIETSERNRDAQRFFYFMDFFFGYFYVRHILDHPNQA